MNSPPVSGIDSRLRAFLVAAVRYGLLVHKLFYAVDKQWYAGKVTLWMWVPSSLLLSVSLPFFERERCVQSLTL